jgi:hypothetical protein
MRCNATRHLLPNLVMPFSFNPVTPLPLTTQTTAWEGVVIVMIAATSAVTRGGYLQVVMIAPTSGEALSNVVRKMACWHPKHFVEYFVEFRWFRDRLNV